jgi:hypothetical protein
MKNSEVAALFKTIADSFLALSEIYSSATEEAPKKEMAPKKETPVKEEPAPAEPETTNYSKEDVRALLSQKAKIEDCKYKSVVKTLVAKYSTDGTLTKVPVEKYAELMAELEVIGNA